MPKPAYDEASKVDAIDGEVTVSGPDGVGLSMTPRAAHETAVRLAVKAGKAREQSREMDERG